MLVKCNNIFINNSESDKLFHKNNIDTTSFYYVSLVSCNSDYESINISSIINFRQTYGYLSADLYKVITCSTTFSVFYVILLLFWVIYCICTCTFHTIQMWITLLLLLCVIDTPLLKSYLTDYNQNAVVNPFKLFSFVIFYTLRKLLSRIFLLFASRGIGTTIPTIGSLCFIGSCFGLIYFIFAFFQIMQFVMPESLFYSSTFNSHIPVVMYFYYYYL